MSLPSAEWQRSPDGFRDKLCMTALYIRDCFVAVLLAMTGYQRFSVKPLTANLRTKIIDQKN